MILLACILILLVYVGALWLYPLITLQVTAFVAVAAVLVIGAWIGWVMATTPPPAPLEARVPEQGTVQATTGAAAEAKS